MRRGRSGRSNRLARSGSLDAREAGAAGTDHRDRRTLREYPPTARLDWPWAFRQFASGLQSRFLPPPKMPPSDSMGGMTRAGGEGFESRSLAPRLVPLSKAAIIEAIGWIIRPLSSAGQNRIFHRAETAPPGRRRRNTLTKMGDVQKGVPHPVRRFRLTSPSWLHKRVS